MILKAEGTLGCGQEPIMAKQLVVVCCQYQPTYRVSAQLSTPTALHQSMHYITGYF